MYWLSELPVVIYQYIQLPVKVAQNIVNILSCKFTSNTKTVDAFAAN